jgi:hypothetical protein
MTVLVVAVSVLLALAACERKGGNPPKPVTEAPPVAFLWGGSASGGATGASYA